MQRQAVPLVTRPLVTFLCLFAHPTASHSQSPIEVRTRDGRVFLADSVEFRGGRVVVRPHGGSPIELNSSDIVCFGEACHSQSPTRTPADSVASTNSYSERISIQGSNTIGATLMPTLVPKFG
jgi:hypothetical protein